MKKLSVILVAVMALGLVVTACSSSDGDNDCVKAASVMLSGADEACSGKSDTCWTCKCWNDGHKTATTTDGTTYTCEAPTTTECKDDPNTDVDECACEGDALKAATACLADETACKKPMLDAMNLGCDNTTIE